MRRDPSLAPLSREHHQALVIAQGLRRAEHSSASAAVAAFESYWVEHGARHFEVEEQVLLPAYAEVGDPHAALIGRVLCDHVELRCRGREAVDAPTSSLERLHVLGRRLAEHVRLEEQELFPLIERTLTADRLRGLASEIRRAETTGPPS